MRSFLTLVLALGLCPVARAEVRLPALVGSHMVLQRDAPARVWGWASPGEAVRLSVGAARGEATAAADGRWTLDLPPQPAGGPFVLTIAGRTTTVLEDVWFGEVWVASGQSNMEWPLAQATGGPGGGGGRLRRSAPLHRRQGHVAAAQGRRERRSGRSATRRRRRRFSAVAFYFGQDLHRALGVKVGLVHSSWGGTPAEAWTSREALAAEPSLRPMVADFDAALNDPGRAEGVRGAARRLGGRQLPPGRRERGLRRRGGPQPRRRRCRLEAMELPQPWEKAGLAHRRRGLVPASGPGPGRVGRARTCASRSARSTTSTRPTSPARRSAAPARRLPATTRCPAATPCPAVS